MRRSSVGLGILAALVVVTVLVTGPAPGGEGGPQGTLALRRFLARMGLDVRNGDAPPEAARGPSVFVLLTDLRTPREARDLIAWVRSGGTLVIADPASATLAAAGIGPGARVGHSSFGPAHLPPGCVAPETVGVRALAVDPADSTLSPGAAGAAGCFPAGGPAGGGDFEISRPFGTGRLVALGGTSPLTNALLSEADNAAFALGVFGSGGPVVFGPATPPGSAAPGGLWATLPLPARLVVIQIAIALVVFALVRARRFGKPLAERVPSPVPAGELVEAVGRLYRSSRASSFAGETLRRATLRRLRSRLGAGPEMDARMDRGAEEALSSTLAQLSGGDAERIRRLLTGPGPAGDEELIALGRELEELRRRVEGSWV